MTSDLSGHASSRRPSPSSGAAGGSHDDVLADPYREWLGVESVERPPSYYALLGLAELESDARKIADASRKVKKTIRAYQIGKYRKQALGLMTEIGQAVDVLGNAAKKDAYDRDRLAHSLELAQANFPHAELDRPLDAMFADWIGQCHKIGLPVPQLLPRLMSWCLGRAYSWPTRGAHKTPLPLALWIYFEAAVVGQCVERSPVEQRIRAVKATQQAFGITEQLSRIVNLEIARRPQAFAESDIVRTAADQPREQMQQWVDRLASRGVVLEPDSLAYRALAFLLGLVGEDGRPIAEPVTPRTVQSPEGAGPGAGASLADLGVRLGETLRSIDDRVPGLKIALLIAVGLVAVFLLLLMFM